MEHNDFYHSIRVRLHRQQPFFGPGVARLLRLVDEVNSLQTAASIMGMSYSKAWKIVKAAEKELDFPLMERHVGGSGGGSSQLTPKGQAFLKRYDAFEQAVFEESERLFLEYFGGGHNEKD